MEKIKIDDYFGQKLMNEDNFILPNWIILIEI